MKCDYGCCENAKFILANGKNCCSKSYNSCIAVKTKNSNSLKKAYTNGSRNAKETYKNMNLEAKNKMKWNKGKFLNPQEDVFVENSTHSTEYIKGRIKTENLLEYVCKCCGINTWNEKPLILELDHINGCSSDNRLENLRFLCPNCHSQTETFRGRNINKGVKKVEDAVLIKALTESKSIRKALITVGLIPKGANYFRCYKLLNNLSASTEM